MKAENEIYNLSDLIPEKELGKLLMTHGKESFSNKNMVVISEDAYLKLFERSETLRALEQGGVDNWSYYNQALKDYFGEDEDENEEEYD